MVGISVGVGVLDKNIIKEFSQLLKQKQKCFSKVVVNGIHVIKISDDGSDCTSWNGCTGLSPMTCTRLKDIKCEFKDTCPYARGCAHKLLIFVLTPGKTKPSNV